MSVKVNQLEWEPSRYGEEEAYTPIGFFRVYSEEYGGSYGTFNSIGGGFVDGFTPDRNKPMTYAKQQCQEYFERLVMDCLEADNDPE
jgi:hypothetical protein